MRRFYFLLLVFAAFLFTPRAAWPQEPAGSALAVRELWTRKSTDGRSHNVEAIALGRSGDADVLYVIERDSEPGPPSKSKDGDDVLWKLDAKGRVLHKELLRKTSSVSPTFATIVPLRPPQVGAIIVGMFEERYGWSILRVNGAGKITGTRSLAGDSFPGAALSPDGDGILLVGNLGHDGLAWKADLDGNVLWKRTCRPKTSPDGKGYTDLVKTAFTDQEGGFVAAGWFRESLNKFGLGKASLWLASCDAKGTILAETMVPGRSPSIFAAQKSRFTMLYDASSALALDCRVRAMDSALKQEWERRAEFLSLWVDPPAISPIPSDRGYVLAGCNTTTDKVARQECRLFQCDANGQVVSSASIPITQKAFLFTRVVCAADRAYVAIQTKGMTPYDAREASIFEIRLRKQDR